MSSDFNTDFPSYYNLDLGSLQAAGIPYEAVRNGSFVKSPMDSRLEYPATNLYHDTLSTSPSQLVSDQGPPQVQEDTAQKLAQSQTQTQATASESASASKDKREKQRRNSANFRQKKKIRDEEQASLITDLQSRLTISDRENTTLKGIIRTLLIERSRLKKHVSYCIAHHGTSSDLEFEQKLGTTDILLRDYLATGALSWMNHDGSDSLHLDNDVLRSLERAEDHP
ncbi:uncharacterized protein I303_107994 [Kwoniella dejecticola CBS 10117]|uniref:BZIP domain-containing protein n=1 Tax=Kwoniella dejecticola CBS 10117 TaxID=1296121 RepID=A0A1A5ZW80_9TREE|nr:uncharacterized protein I303_07985 [Kwoniella dejecticola CBS 10117]OBR82071.1 hypothetical protein I303_07985 [Kwoniella dejecticola CBS 10117]